MVVLISLVHILVTVILILTFFIIITTALLHPLLPQDIIVLLLSDTHFVIAFLLLTLRFVAIPVRTLFAAHSLTLDLQTQNNEPFTEGELQDIHVAFQTTDVDSVLLGHIPIIYYDEDIPDFDQLDELQISDYDVNSLDEKVKKFYTELEETVRADSDPYMIVNTEQQSERDTWKIIRCLMVTASKAKTVLGLTSERAKMNFLRRHLWGIGNITTKDMQYGIKNEGKALEAYKKWLKNPPLEVKQTGLWVPKRQPYLGCSPDAVVYKDGIN
ncbi:hypothetical protein FOCC_FOCC015153 [Frankliniella occidentalis]|nr:hypothetical protein FOCC_FOCC015153 [Frankliniella occidentalis]